MAVLENNRGSSEEESSDHDLSGERNDQQKMTVEENGQTLPGNENEMTGSGDVVSEDDDVSVTVVEKSTPDHPVDRGWAWVVLAGCVFEIFVYGGIMRSFGVFFLQFQMRFGSNASETAIMSLIQNVMISVSALFIMTVGLQTFSSRTAVFIGGLLTGLSYLITAFATDIRVFYVFQGGLSGLGMAFIHPPILSMIGAYFNKHRGLANSIFMAGASVGGLVFAPVIVRLFEEYKYEGAMLIVSGLMLNICVAACLMRPTSFYSNRKKTKPASKIHETEEEMKLIEKNASGETNALPERVHPLHKSNEINGGSHGEISSIKTQSFMRIQSHDPTSRKANIHGGSPLLQRVRTSSVDRVGLGLRHRTQSEGYDKDADSENDIHGSKGKLKDVFEAISRSQRNVTCASDGMFGSFIDINQPMVEIETDLNDTADDGGDGHEGNDKTKSEATGSGCCFSMKKCVLSMLSTMFDVHLLRNPVFIAFLFMAFMFIAGVALAPAYMPPLAKEVGISNDRIASIISLMSVIDLVSKIVVGFVADRGWIKRSTILVIVAFLFGTASQLVVFVKSFETIIVFAIVMGLCCGQYTSMYAVVLQDVTGPEKFTKSLGFGTLVHGTSIAIFFPIAGLIRDITNSYVGTFQLFGGLAYMAGILVLIINFINKRKAAREKKKRMEASPS